MSIRDIKDWSTQEVFDFVAEHLLTQGKQAIKDDGSEECVYRAHNGLKCAVGCLISDEEYTYKLEGTAIQSLVRFFPEISPHQELLVDLQDIHDSGSPESWFWKLHDLAEELNLSTNVLEEFND